MVFTLEFQEWLALCIQYAIQRQRVFVLRSVNSGPVERNTAANAAVLPASVLCLAEMCSRIRVWYPQLLLRWFAFPAGPHFKTVQRTAVLLPAPFCFCGLAMGISTKFFSLCSRCQRL